MRITAGAVGTSITTTLWDDRAAVHHVQLTEQISNASGFAASDVMAKLAAAGLDPQQAAAQLNRMIDQQAAMMSANDIFGASAVLFLLMIGLVWLARPVRPGSAPVDASGAH